ncbi:hypothetical protein [Pedobacter sp. NJ-S-72]
MYIGAIPSFSGSASALVGAMSYLSAFLITSALGLFYNQTAYPMILMMWFCAIVAYLCLRHKNPLKSNQERDLKLFNHKTSIIGNIKGENLL